MQAVTGILCNMHVLDYLLGHLKFRLYVHEQCKYSVCVCVCVCVYAYAYVHACVRAYVRACMRAHITIVLHTVTYAVTGILRNMQVLDYL